MSSGRHIDKEENKIQRTKIEWIKNPDGSQGFSLNPIKGKCPMACKDNNGKIYCYNHKRIDRFHLNPTVRFDEDVLHKAQLWSAEHPNKTVGIFLCSTFEWLWNKDWAEELIIWIESLMSRHRFYLLTKRPQDLRLFNPFPENCWVGMSVTKGGIGIASTGAITCFEDIQAKVKFVSFEPLLEQVDFGYYTDFVDWVIIGQKTPVSKKTSPKLEWIKEIVEACDKASIPVFLKDNLLLMFKTDIGADGYNQLYFRGDRLRQEFPDVKG